MQVSPWVPDAALAASSGFPEARSRTASYIRPISIPMPFSPKQCNVFEAQSVGARPPLPTSVSSHLHMLSRSPPSLPNLSYLFLQLMIREAGGFVVQKKVTTNAPKGDTFHVLLLFVGISEGNSTRVSISFQVDACG